MTEKNTGYGWTESSGISLYEKMRQDMKAAMKNKDSEVRDTMRLIMGELPKLTVAITLESGKKTTRVKTPEEITNEDMKPVPPEQWYLTGEYISRDQVAFFIVEQLDGQWVVWCAENEPSSDFLPDICTY